MAAYVSFVRRRPDHYDVALAARYRRDRRAVASGPESEQPWSFFSPFRLWLGTRQDNEEHEIHTVRPKTCRWDRHHGIAQLGWFP
jgi:hypothetical protein